jgi:hypothetical protein
MASTQEFPKKNLSPDDVPGASINIDDFESCSIVQLMRWQVGMQVIVLLKIRFCLLVQRDLIVYSI